MVCVLIRMGLQALWYLSLPTSRVIADKNITFYHIHVFFLSLILIFVNAMLC